MEEWSILDAFKFSISDLVTNSGLSVETITNFLNAFSFSKDGNPTFTSLHEFNATNAYPLLKVDNEQYILFQYVALTEALYDTPFYWMVADKNYSQTAMANRGKFTEEFAAERLERVFGVAKVFRNVDIWESKGKKSGEIDTLVLFANRAIVVQAKSKKLTLDARKGNDLQLKSDFKGAVQDACDQALECSEKLAVRSLEFKDSTGKEIKIPESIKKIHPVCLVSEHYPALSFQARQFLKYKKSDLIETPLVCDVFLLDVITEMLDTPLRCLSYLQLRAMAGDNVMLSHENVALGYHLKRNLWLGKYDVLQLHDDISADLDVAMMVRRDGIEGERTPRGILTQMSDLRLGKIVKEIEKRSEPALVELGLEILKLSGETTREISEAIDKIASVSAKDGREHDISVGFKKTESGITVHCNSQANNFAVPKLERHCELRKYSEKAALWHGIAIRPGDAALRFGVMLDYPWKEDASLDKVVQGMPKPLPPKSLPNLIQNLSPKPNKIGRNERCPCGSGLKYKKCCLQKN